MGINEKCLLDDNKRNKERERERERVFKGVLVLFLILLVPVLVSGTAFAATKTVSGTTFKDIQSTIDSSSSGDVISLSNTTYKGSGTYIRVNKSNIVIQGPSSSKYATVDGMNLSRVFYVTGTNVTLKYVTITKGKATDSSGSGIRWTGSNGKLQDSIIKNNYGSSVFWAGANPYISFCIFDNNVGDSGAGLFINETGTNAKVLNTKFTNNKAILNINNDNYTEGGGLDTHVGTEINSCTFTGNLAKNGGGGLCLARGTSTVINSIFSYNNASAGGAVRCSGGSTVSFAGSTFTNNKATGSAGGAIYGTNSTVTVSSSNFNSNDASSYGGAIYSNGLLTISTSNFTNNKASSNGGGVYGASTTRLNSGNIFTSNSAVNGAGAFIVGNGSSVIGSTFKTNKASSNGGGLYSSGNVAISGSAIFDANTANYGAGAYISSSSSSISGSTFKNNIASVNGGGLYSSSVLTVTGSSFASNSAVNGAGAIIYGAGSSISSSSFGSNKASANGGGLYGASSVTLGSGSSFVSNSAVNGAGAFIVGSGSVTGSTFTSNIASGSGAGLYSSNILTVSNSSFGSNKASSNGGGLYSTSSVTLGSGSSFVSNSAVNGAGAFIVGSGSVTGSTFTSNVASANGGALYSSNNLNINGSVFSLNKATNYGGAAYLLGASVFINDSNFNSSGAAGGGAIYKSGGNLEINLSNFTNNHASTGGAVFKTNCVLILNNLVLNNNTASNSVSIKIPGGILYGKNSVVSVKYNGGNNLLNAVWNNDGGVVSINGSNVSSAGSLSNQNIRLIINGKAYNNITDDEGLATFNMVMYPTSSWVTYNLSTSHLSSGAVNNSTVKVRVTGNTTSKVSYAVVTKVPYNTDTRLYDKFVYLKNKSGVFKQSIVSGKSVWTKQSATIISKTVSAKVYYYLSVNGKSYALNKTNSSHFYRLVPKTESRIISYSFTTKKWYYNYNASNLGSSIVFGNGNITGGNNKFYLVYKGKSYLLTRTTKYSSANTYYYLAKVPAFSVKYNEKVKCYTNVTNVYSTSTIFDGVNTNKSSIFTSKDEIAEPINKNPSLSNIIIKDDNDRIYFYHQLNVSKINSKNVSFWNKIVNGKYEPYIQYIYNFTLNDTKKTTKSIVVWEKTTTDMYFVSDLTTKELEKYKEALINHNENKIWVHVGHEDVKKQLIVILKDYEFSRIDGQVTSLSKAKSIYKWVGEKEKYGLYWDSKHSDLWAIPRINGIAGKGAKSIDLINCADHSNLVVSFLRTAGIPAVYAHSYFYGGHYWACAYVKFTKNGKEVTAWHWLDTIHPYFEYNNSPKTKGDFKTSPKLAIDNIKYASGEMVTNNDLANHNKY
ncbi:MAG: hypothetical protein ACRC1M_01860 [Methanobacteriaceae archaeon]